MPWNVLAANFVNFVMDIQRRKSDSHPEGSLFHHKYVERTAVISGQSFSVQAFCECISFHFIPILIYVHNDTLFNLWKHSILIKFRQT